MQRNRVGGRRLGWCRRGVARGGALCLGALVALGLSGAAHRSARAAETVIPVTPPGATDTDQAFLPPQTGLYGGLVLIPFNQNSGFYDFSGRKLPGVQSPMINLQLVVPALLYVYPFQVFGGTLGSTVVLPLERLHYTLGGGAFQHTEYGVADLYSDVFYWTRNVGLLGATPGPLPLSYGLSVGGGLALIAPTGNYSKKYPLNNGGNLWVIDPNVAATYNTGPHLSLGDNTQVSARAFLGNPLRNPATHYQSGSVFDVDWSATEQFGPLRIGAAGYYQAQLTNDRPGDGESLPNGNRFFEAAAGPVIEYFFRNGAFLKAKYQYTFYRRNFVDEQYLVVSVGMKF